MFFASILVPVLKLIGLVFLLVSVQRGSTGAPAPTGRVLYRIIEGIGRWSMVDVFMIGILAALVALGNLATIDAGAGCHRLLRRRHRHDPGLDVVRSTADVGRDR